MSEQAALRCPVCGGVLGRDNAPTWLSVWLLFCAECGGAYTDEEVRAGAAPEPPCLPPAALAWVQSLEMER